MYRNLVNIPKFWVEFWLLKISKKHRMLAHFIYNIEIWLYIICKYDILAIYRANPPKKKKKKKKARKKVGWLWARNCSNAVAVKHRCRRCKSDGGHIEAQGGWVLQPALAAGLLLGSSSSSSYNEV
jgi:hypothetical protein